MKQLDYSFASSKEGQVDIGLMKSETVLGTRNQ